MSRSCTHPKLGPGLAKATADRPGAPQRTVKQNAEEYVRRECVRLYQLAGFRSQAHAAGLIGTSVDSVQEYLTCGDNHRQIPAWFRRRLEELAEQRSGRRSA